MISSSLQNPFERQSQAHKLPISANYWSSIGNKLSMWFTWPWVRTDSLFQRHFILTTDLHQRERSCGNRVLCCIRISEYVHHLSTSDLSSGQHNKAHTHVPRNRDPENGTPRSNTIRGAIRFRCRIRTKATDYNGRC